MTEEIQSRTYKKKDHVLKLFVRLFASLKNII